MFKRFFSALLFLIACYYIMGQDGIKEIRIDPKAAYGGNISEYFDSIEYIPLETNKASLFGDVYNLLVTDSSFIITDSDTRTTLFFNNAGKYIRKINWPKGVDYIIPKPNPYNKIILLSYMDEFKRNAVKKIEYVDFFGKKINNQKHDNSTLLNNIFIDSCYSLKFNKCSFLNPSDIKDSIYHLIDVYKNEDLYKRLIPYNQKEKMAFCYIAGAIPKEDVIISSGGDFYLATPIENIIYKINKENAVPFLKIIFPLNAAYETDILSSSSFKEIDSVKNVPRSIGTIYHFRNIFFHKSKFFFKGDAALYFSKVSNQYTRLYNFIYDTLTNKLVAIERVIPDMTTNFLPIYNVHTDGLMINGLKYKDEYVYSHVSSLEMFSAKEATKSKNPQYPPVLQEYFKTQNRKSNPVIVKMKLKE